MITLVRNVINTLFGTTDELSPEDKNLLEAAEDGDLASVKALLEQGADIEARDWSGKTPLFLALMSENPEVLNLFLAEGASVNARNHLGQTPLHRAGSGEAVNQLLAWGADIEARDNDENTPLFSACHQDDLEMLKVFLDKGACVNARNDAGQIPLHRAGSGEIAKELLARGADIEARDNGKATPLICAVSNSDRLEVVKELLVAGANIEAADKFKRTSLHFAASENCHDLRYLGVLLSEGANLEARQKSTEWTPLHLAANSGSGKKVQLLVAEGANCKARDWHRDTPLNFAKGKIGNMKVLLAAAGRFDNINRNNEPGNFQPQSLQACARASIRSRLVEHRKETGQPLSKSVPMLPLELPLEPPLEPPLLKDYIYEPLMGKLIFD
ncbi:ankyrin repeat domain-containing protein [Endozoicomonas sp. YOMI1]|uniref:ankyrin repeat domain-containing protein n=1 Tax=Endozoicomonas sp. YOMI1 TaxID=2828739 RepID=UPI002147C5B2|nr:ankyrin repeat domain-containing protein [Endozoicomonas sp. YOMI1]